ncbi:MULTISPECIES: hypothetical protein [Pseudomonas]|uniref:hypothetical protein n=1 Tax=Pseudomonas TaxID=286 RepID=UPI001CE4662C|nr:MULTISPECIES: hypothetical protein [Pseudomonas]MCO7593085.1 hypothetical protein [Pseudomonas guariconensis]MCO7631832.1 hypothetical protein [Pseudomonas guariconensis]MCU7221257.1 hypothetical protein [Pseudomonas brassicacearum]
MLTWRAWIKMMQALEPHKRVTCMLFAGFIFLCFLPLFFMNWEKSTQPATSPWVRAPAALASNPETWRHDKSLYSFAIVYKQPERQPVKTWVYAHKARYDAAKISKTTPLFVEVEDALSGPIVRRLSASDETLYDPALKQYVIETYNRQSVEGIVFFSTLGLASFIAAGVMHWQNRQRKKQQATFSS